MLLQSAPHRLDACSFLRSATVGRETEQQISFGRAFAKTRALSQTKTRRWWRGELRKVALNGCWAFIVILFFVEIVDPSESTVPSMDSED